MNVSIVTSVLNGAKFLPACIESVATQTIACEHILVDGGSSDGSQDVARARGLKVIHAPASNISEAFNIGIQNCSGDVIAILNADDWLEPDAAEKSLRALQTRPQCGFSFGSIVLHFERYSLVVHPRAIAENLAQQAIRQIPFAHISSFVRRSVYAEHGMYDAQFKVAMDYDFYARITTRGVTGVYVDGILAHATSGGKSANTFVRLKDYARIFSRYHNRFSTAFQMARFAINSILYEALPQDNPFWRMVKSKGNRVVIDERTKGI